MSFLPWYMFSCSSFWEESVEWIISSANCFIRWHLPIWLDAMLQTVEFPAGITNLTTSLTNMNGNTFTLKREKLMVRSMFNDIPTRIAPPLRLVTLHDKFILRHVHQHYFCSTVSIMDIGTTLVCLMEKYTRDTFVADDSWQIVQITPMRSLSSTYLLIYWFPLALHICCSPLS